MPFEPYQPPEGGITNQLAAIGLTAVSDLVLKNYRNGVWYKDRSGGRWLDVMLPNGDGLVRSLQAPKKLRPTLSWWSAAPKPVQQLAARVQMQIPEATFSLGYFRKDPYLIVSLRTNGRHECACLAIWKHRFHLVAIAH